MRGQKDAVTEKNAEDDFPARTHSKNLECRLKKEGYNGASSTIQMFATRERRLLKKAKSGQGQPVEKLKGNGWSVFCINL